MNKTNGGSLNINSSCYAISGLVLLSRIPKLVENAYAHIQGAGGVHDEVTKNAIRWLLRTEEVSVAMTVVGGVLAWRTTAMFDTRGQHDCQEYISRLLALFEENGIIPGCTVTQKTYGVCARCGAVGMYCITNGEYVIASPLDGTRQYSELITGVQMVRQEISQNATHTSRSMESNSGMKCWEGNREKVYLINTIKPRASHFLAFLNRLDGHTKNTSVIEWDPVACGSKLYKPVAYLVHLGGANSGHYVTFVNDSERGWVEYNDASARVVDVAYLERIVASCAVGALYKCTEWTSERGRLNAQLFNGVTANTKNAATLVSRYINANRERVLFTHSDVVVSERVRYPPPRLNEDGVRPISDFITYSEFTQIKKTHPKTIEYLVSQFFQQNRKECVAFDKMDENLLYCHVFSVLNRVRSRQIW